MVNSVRMDFVNISSGSDLSIFLLAADHADVPQTPSGWEFIGVWQFDSLGDLGFDSVDLTFRYDDAMSSSLGLDEDDLTVFHYNGANWVDVTGTIDIGNNLIYANDISSFSHFAVGAVPEPATLALVALGGLVLRRRDYRIKGNL